MIIDKSLLMRLQQQDRSAFEEIYTISHPALYRFILKMVKSPELAEDVCHDVFVKLWDKSHLIDADRPLQPFLFEIAKNHLLNFIKRNHREKAIIAEMMKHAEQASNTTEHSYQYRETRARLADAIEQLPPQRRHIFQLCKEEELSYMQVATHLRISESTVNNQIVKALKFVRGSLSSLLMLL
ncbi:RNA polymerase sigma-70 factor [Pseudoflavitalea sp. G-6-1-2]|uniref:RNA polymerase sigma factor n=1 Tax=Pseudoflavitalea sp. G-6-1-2 TaxID=2728841 RepID=UPI00146B70AE|nr:RNA polymerase sigma-70 factor [Pseudoflavitalea sp. G-6-1-2]NML21979.1 RNA polymerase sigma-70 factor [Pseudoflavitalea sp. G-6-1-2]